ncbi:hypothetical protein, partial [Actinomadura rubrisoli]|uniref:hypothetical protein n=1 Tax=Actinomadura rubrisoli TaxID=2530368 RepID=UPI001A9EE461
APAPPFAEARVQAPTPPAVVSLDGAIPLTLHVEPVEMISGVDVIVSSENTYLEMSKRFHNTLSAALRRAGARLGESGELLDDTVHRELVQWQREHSGNGLPVAPGTVAATGPGELRHSGVRRIYHAAVAIPEADGTTYRVGPESVGRGVHNVFRVAVRERRLFTPPLRRIAFPLFGAGRGQVDPAESFAWLWSSIEREARLGDLRPREWDLHIITRSPASAAAVIDGFGHGPP